ncbi:alpha/beta hydrolase family protein [Paenibacillus roseipurpureus]|uniref:Dienelactone hydrolase family protein n=1 Tax=Paenibacillus roseopurpureus TaxID=2918901 RepID=A0AA96RJ64_9BACL|nr:dienelactone hydrolase family protein [Paenibacillus sp. MBLB1832]WNR42964.1 dienelactone hydrolase family protein [Paenibacillus sp. MBLB1832]
MSYYSEDYRVSREIREEQYDQLKRYIAGKLTLEVERNADLFLPDTSSLSGYMTSLTDYRLYYERVMGYDVLTASPLPPVIAREEYVAEDSVSSIYRLYIEVEDGLECYGLYLLPRTIAKKYPLMVHLHGGGGCPEMICSFGKPNNYNEASRRMVQAGFAVFCPLYSFRSFADEEDTAIPPESRVLLENKAREWNTSLTAIELFKLRRSLDHLLARPEIQSREVGVAGLSYGGYHSLISAALEPRFQFCICSCGLVVENPNDYSHLHARLGSRIVLHQLIAMIAPRLCIIEAGLFDEGKPLEPGRWVISQAARYFEELGIPEKLHYIEFDGTHEFHLSRSLTYLLGSLSWLDNN